MMLFPLCADRADFVLKNQTVKILNFTNTLKSKNV